VTRVTKPEGARHRLENGDRVAERLIEAGIVAVGIAIGGALIGNGFARAKGADRYVTVKGVTEREVRADLAIWPLHVVAADNDLNLAHSKLEKSIAGVRQFLASRGLDTTKVELTGFSVSDAQAAEYGGEQRRGSRFILKQSVILRSSDVDKVLAASQHVGGQGVFEILPRDEAPGISEGSQVSKRVRVVSTVDYFLKN
jgi:hypothetical protein